MKCKTCAGNLDSCRTGKPLCSFTEDIIEYEVEGCRFYMKEDIIDRLKREGKCRTLSIEESQIINDHINKGMQEVRRDYMKKSGGSKIIADEIIINS